MLGGGGIRANLRPEPRLRIMSEAYPRIAALRVHGTGRGRARYARLARLVNVSRARTSFGSARVLSRQWQC